MATTTSNLGLVKPTDAEYALITELNANSDKIDAEVGKERSNFALVQNGDTATQAISKDQLVVWKGVLKKATANIASGATLSGSNLSDDTIAAELAALNSNLAQLLTVESTELSFTSSQAVTPVRSGYKLIACIYTGGRSGLFGIYNTNYVISLYTPSSAGSLVPVTDGNYTGDFIWLKTS